MDGHRSDGVLPVIERYNVMKPPEVIQATSESTSKYIAQSVEDIKASKAKREADDRMRAGLLSEPNTDRATPDACG